MDSCNRGVAPDSSPGPEIPMGWADKQATDPSPFLIVFFPSNLPLYPGCEPFHMHHMSAHHNKSHLPITLWAVFSPPGRCQKTPSLHVNLCLPLSFTGARQVPVFSCRPGINSPEPVCGSLSAVQFYGHWAGTDVLSCHVDTENQIQDLWTNRKCS